MNIIKNGLPFGHFSTIFSFRDEIVHAKTKIIGPKRVQIDKQSLKPKIPKSFVEQNADYLHAKKYYDSMVEMIERLHVAAGYDTHPFGNPLTVVWSSKLV